MFSEHSSRAGTLWSYSPCILIVALKMMLQREYEGSLGHGGRERLPICPYVCRCGKVPESVSEVLAQLIRTYAFGILPTVLSVTSPSQAGGLLENAESILTDVQIDSIHELRILNILRACHAA